MNFSQILVILLSHTVSIVLGISSPDPAPPESKKLVRQSSTSISPPNNTPAPRINSLNSNQDAPAKQSQINHSAQQAFLRQIPQLQKAQEQQNLAPGQAHSSIYSHMQTGGTNQQPPGTTSGYIVSVNTQGQPTSLTPGLLGIDFFFLLLLNVLIYT